MKNNVLIYILLAGIFCLISCSPALKKPDQASVVVFPKPPAKARIQYLTSISSSADIAKKRSRFASYVMGSEEELSIHKPYGISIKNGKLYICDTQLGGVEIIHLGKGTFSYFKPKGMGQFKKPINCDADSDNNLFIADIDRRQILVFDGSGNFVNSFGEAELAKPTDIKIYQNKIIVADLKKQKIYIYAKESLELLTAFPEVNKDASEFLHSPTNLAVADGKIYVSDLGAFNVKIFDMNGDYVSTVGGYGKSPGRFIRPKGVAVDHDLNLHVVDAGFENVQIFNKENQLLMYYGGKYQGKGDLWLPAKVLVDYDHLRFFNDYVHDGYILKYLIFVTNQFGPDKVSVYGFIE